MSKQTASESLARPFAVAVYARAYEVDKMRDPMWLAEQWHSISSQLKVDKIYLETHRDLLIPPAEDVAQLRDFFVSQGLKVAGGITYTIDESNRFQTFCYTNPDDRRKVQEIIEHSASLFDEVILDDFFFTNCKCDACIEAKGLRSWTEFRLEQMNEAAQSLILGPAKAVNPNVQVVIKYPNWYEHFQGLGFDLETGPGLFDGIYTGTETRQPTHNAQHLQPYHGYSIVRYFENLAPGRNGGGWVDTGGMTYADRYAEQIWLTLFAKAPEITLFDWRQLQYPVMLSNRGAWQGEGTSLDFDGMVAPHIGADGSLSTRLTVASLAAASVDAVEPLIAKLGNPIGIPSFRPHHATGEDNLHSYLGMIGLPIDLRPEYPEAKSCLLTEFVKHDPYIVSKIERSLRWGHTVTITSGLLLDLQIRGLRDIVDVSVLAGKVQTEEFYLSRQVFRSEKLIILPQIAYLTNDAWEIIGADANGYPLLLESSYGNGLLRVLAIPDNFADLYRLPEPVLNRLRALLSGALFARIEGPSGVCLFAYDNQTLILESFSDQEVEVDVVLEDSLRALTDLGANSSIKREVDDRFEVTLRPHSFRAFQAKEADRIVSGRSQALNPKAVVGQAEENVTEEACS